MGGPPKNELEQRATERRHLEAFLEIAGIRAVIERHGGQPDFVLVLEGRRIGLEQRELTEEDLAANAPNLAWLEKALAQELRQRGLDWDLHVGVSVNATSPFFRKCRELEDLVPRLAAFAAERGPTATREKPLQVLARDLNALGIVGV